MNIKKHFLILLRKKKNNENELIVMKALKEKNTILEIKPKSRTKKQTKSLTTCNNKLIKLGKQLVQNVLNKFSYLNKKQNKKQLLKENNCKGIYKHMKKKKKQRNKTKKI